MFDKISAIILLLSLAVFFISRKSSFLLAFVFYALLIPTCIMLLHSSFAYELSLLSHGCRIGLPLILYLDAKRMWGARFSKVFMLRLAVAFTFIGHGLEALWEHPNFIDFIVDSSYFFNQKGINEVIAIKILAFIGAVDIVFAVSGLVKPRVWIYLWMGSWALLAAISKVIYLKGNGVIPMMLSTSDWAIAFVAAYLILNIKRKQTQ